jgi:hypothetical protein
MKKLFTFWLLIAALNVFAQPSNDNKANAIELTDLSTWTSADAAYSNVGATQDGSGACGAAGGDVWFKFQATTTEIEMKVLSGGTKGTIGGFYLSLFNAAGAVVGCGLSNGTGVNGIFGIIQKTTLSAGEMYYFSVDGYSTSSGTFTISVNDQIGFDLKEKAHLLTSISSWTSADGAFSNVGASRDGNGACGAANGDVWFKFQATTNEIEIRVSAGSTKGTAGGFFLALEDQTGMVKGCGVSNGTGVNSIFGIIQILTLTPGAWYYLSVDSYVGGAGTFTVSIKDNVGFDLKAKAELLTSIDSWTSPDAAYSNFDASRDGNGACGAANGDVWFKFQATTNMISIKVSAGETKGTALGFYLALHNQTGTPIACGSSNLSVGNILYGIVQYTSLVPGEWYYFSVDSYAGNAGTFTLSIKDDLGFDSKEGALLIDHLPQWCSADAGFDNSEATVDAIGNTAVGYNKNVWFKFKATSNSVRIQLLTGAGKGTLSYPVIFLTDDDGIAITSNSIVVEYSSLQKGSWYLISVGNSAGAGGTFTLCVEGGGQPSQFCEAIYCDNEGNVSIGAPIGATGYKLSVDGKVMAEGVKVELQSKWPDYVFNKQFRIPSLLEVKDYIATHGHLPEVPKASEVEAGGIDLGEMNTVLLKKIEELTLYLIQQNSQLTQQAFEIKTLAEEVKHLKSNETISK